MRFTFVLSRPKKFLSLLGLLALLIIVAVMLIGLRDDQQRQPAHKSGCRGRTSY